MANVLYDKGREGFLDGSIDWDTDDIRVVLVRSSYTFSAAHDFLDDITSGNENGRSAALGSKTVTSGVADAADTTITAAARCDRARATATHRDRQPAARRLPGDDGRRRNLSTSPPC